MAAKRGPNNHNRKRRKGPRPETIAKTDARAQYLISLIDDDPKLDGCWGKLVRAVMERYGVSANPAEKAVTRCYELLAIQRAQTHDQKQAYLERAAKRAIDIGFEVDPRILNGAIDNYRKITGVGEPDVVHHTGSIGMKVTPDDVEILAALKLTPAQRLAEIDRIEKELAEEDAPKVEKLAGVKLADPSLTAADLAAITKPPKTGEPAQPPRRKLPFKVTRGTPADAG